MDRTVLRDVYLLFPISIILFILVVMFSFRSLTALLVIGSTVIVTVTSTLGLMAWRGTTLTIVSATLPVLLVALGSADGIHVFCRYKETLKTEANKKTALKKAMRSLVAPIFMTSATTAAGFAALMTSSVIPVRDFGLYSVFGILLAMVYSLSGIPAILAIVPKPREALSGSRTGLSLARVLEFVAVAGQKHWKAVLVVGLSSVVVSALGITQLQFESNLARYFRRGSDVSLGIREYEKRFGGSSTLMVIVDSGNEGGTLQPDFMEMLGEMHARVEGYPLLSNTSSFLSFAESITPHGTQGTIAALLLKNLGTIGLQGYISRDGMRKAAIQTYIYSAEAADASRTLLQLEKELKGVAHPGVDVVLAGTPKVVEFHMKEFASSQTRSILISGAAVWLIVSFLFGSIGIGTLAMIPLCLAVLINFGMMGIAGIPLDAATILIASISIGVGADYSIHLLEKITEDEKRLSGSLEAFVSSIRSVGEAIVINTMTLFAGFAVFAFSSFLTVAYFGVLTAMTLAVSCCTALIIIPAFLAIRINRHASSYREPIRVKDVKW